MTTKSETILMLAKMLVAAERNGDREAAHRYITTIGEGLNKIVMESNAWVKKPVEETEFPK
jgi:hypothetical protein